MGVCMTGALTMGVFCYDRCIEDECMYDRSSKNGEDAIKMGECMTGALTMVKKVHVVFD